jgi:hypothetical protein
MKIREMLMKLSETWTAEILMAKGLLWKDRREESQEKDQPDLNEVIGE